ncbi:epidermal growth factor receptor-like [Haliotis rufescens]|uniref:epidermal growth factor receptor-like n=1 Tax=Haliotis rufescens TaxID=6454 RepID=UPI00201F71D7|nr:epidermal growth factor receptor-like [Haliotis rufescens]
MMLLVAMVVLALATRTAVSLKLSSNDIPETGITENDRVCSGSRSSLSSSGSDSWWYNKTVQLYTNCTYVDGNLVVTWLTDENINYDLTFLRNIRYVRGFVLIAGSYEHMDLSLPSLEVIRGNYTFPYGGNEYGLAVLLTNFTSVRLPRLKEISNGKVIFYANRPDIRVEVSRSWDSIVRNREPGAVNIQGHIMPLSPHSDECPLSCPRRCYWYGAGCCHSQCAGGCWGPTPAQCETCKDFELEGVCLSHCPADHYRHGRRCLLNPLYRGGQ